MENVWVYTIENQARGIVIANSQEEATKKVIEAYEKHHDNIDENDVEVQIYYETWGWFEDAPDVLETYELC